MIVTAVNLDSEQWTVLVIVIERDNLDRMRQADPITLESVQKGGRILTKVKYPANLSLLIAYEEDDVELYKIVQSGNLFELMRWLERGRKWDAKTDGKANIVTLGKGKI